MEWMDKLKGAVSGGSGEKIDLNKASREQLSKIDGIGPALADKIVAHREQHGEIRSVDDLKNIDGVGDRTAERTRREAEA